MSLLTRLFSNEPQANQAPIDDFWYRAVPGLTASGMRVDEHTAMKLSAVWRCVNLVAGSVAMLPLLVFERLADGEGKQRAPRHPLYNLLHDQPNRWQTSYEWRELGMKHLLFRGNFYCQIIPGPRGFVDQLWPIAPDAVTPEQQQDRSIKYRVRLQNGQTNTLFDDEVFHVRGLPNDDGVTGLDAITFFANTIGLGMAMESFASKFFSQSPAPGGVFEHPNAIGDEQYQRLKEQLERRTTGGNQQRSLILEQGTKFQQMNVGLTAEQAQIIGAREFTIQDIARWFGVPNHLVGETTKETSWGSGVEEMGIGFVRYTLKFWLARFVQAIRRDLLLVPEKYFAAFVLEELLQADTLKRFQAYTIATGGQPWMTPNEIRSLEDRNAIDGGDELGAPTPAPEPAPAAPQPSRNGTTPANAYAPLIGA